MAETDLIFSRPPGTPDLLFGAVGGPVADVGATVAGALRGLVGAVLAGRLTPATVSGALAGMTGAVTGRYASMTDRPVVARTVAQHQDAARVVAGSQARHTEAARAINGPTSPWGRAGGAQASATGLHRDSSRSARPAVVARHQDADRLPAAGRTARHQNMLRDRRQALTARHQEAIGIGAWQSSGWQDRLRDRRPSRAARWAAGHPLARLWASGVRSGLPVRLGRTSWYQEAMRPPPGTSPRPVAPVPPWDPCYLPDPHLLFTAGPGGPALLYVCERGIEPPGPAATVVVPVRSIYIMNNSVTLRVVATDAMLPVIGFSLQIDADSWTWSFSATLPMSAAASLQPSGGSPVEVEAVINGVPYRLIAERLTTNRTFEATTLQVSGRGRNAVLADPYADRRSFSAAGALTAQQLMLDALTDNGVPIGWTLDFGLTDWSVPGGTWAHQGTWLSAVRTIAEAAGGYVQPHRTDPVLRILPRYPSAPWDWAGLTPDFELPAAVVSTEAIEWLDKPIYNRVYVLGDRNGIMARVTRAGTAGDAVAPSVVDPLITAIEAGRQRGRMVLSDVGRQAAVQISLPVLAETGVIAPGSLVRYLDGATTRLGLVRTTSVNVALQARQTLGVETHVAP